VFSTTAHDVQPALGSNPRPPTYITDSTYSRTRMLAKQSGCPLTSRGAIQADNGRPGGHARGFHGKKNRRLAGAANENDLQAWGGEVSSSCVEGWSLLFSEVRRS